MDRRTMTDAVWGLVVCCTVFAALAAAFGWWLL